MMKNDSKNHVIMSWGEMDSGSGISVAISLYHYAQFIEECLDSVAAQDFQDLQIIVVDDASYRDASLDVSAAWMEKHRKRFGAGVLIQHQVNSGLAETRNTAFRAAACDAVFVMDADNTLYRSCIRKLKRAMDSANADATFSQLVMFGESNDIGYADYWEKSLLARGPYIDAMALVRKGIWQKVGGYTHLEGGWEDYDFWCKLAEQEANVCYVPELLCKYRVHGASMLRTDFTIRHEQLLNLITMRHPWTQLK